MSQEKPERVQVAAGLEIPGGEVVAEAVGAAAAINTSPLFQTGDHYLDTISAHWTPVVGIPQLVAALGSQLQVALERLPGLGADRHHPGLSPLAHDPNLLKPRVHLGQPYPAQFLQPQAASDEEGDDRLVADAQVAVPVLGIVLAQVKHRPDLVVAVGLDIPVAGGGASLMRTDGFSSRYSSASAQLKRVFTTLP